MPQLDILLVDDDPMLRKLYQRVLQIQGHNVRVAVDGPDALNSIAEGPPALMVIDVMMPRMDGMELCRLVRERVPEWFPILFLTALDDLQTLKYCQDAGADDYVVKDGSPDDIVASVDYWQRHLQGELKDSERRLSLAQVIVASEKAQP